MTESFNAGDTVFYKRAPDHYLQCRIVQVVGGQTGVHIALLEADWYPLLLFGFNPTHFLESLSGKIETDQIAYNCGREFHHRFGASLSLALY